MRFLDAFIFLLIIFSFLYLSSFVVVLDSKFATSQECCVGSNACGNCKVFSSDTCNVQVSNQGCCAYDMQHAYAKTKKSQDQEVSVKFNSQMFIG